MRRIAGRREPRGDSAGGGDVAGRYPALRASVDLPADDRWKADPQFAEPHRRAEVLEMGDRRAAIGAAVRLARPGDTVLVAGKGHETGQDIAGTVHPFDDRAVLREVLSSTERPA